MTTVTFHTRGRAASWALKSQGHSGYAEAGEDIVCAAVTSAVRLAECAVNDVLGLEAAVKVREKDAYHLPEASRRPGPDRREHLSDAADGSDGPLCPAA